MSHVTAFWDSYNVNTQQQGEVNQLLVATPNLRIRSVNTQGEEYKVYQDLPFVPLTPAEEYTVQTKARGIKAAAEKAREKRERTGNNKIFIPFNGNIFFASEVRHNTEKNTLDVVFYRGSFALFLALKDPNAFPKNSPVRKMNLLKCGVITGLATLSDQLFLMRRNDKDKGLCGPAGFLENKQEDMLLQDFIKWAGAQELEEELLSGYAVIDEQTLKNLSIPSLNMENQAVIKATSRHFFIARTLLENLQQKNPERHNEIERILTSDYAALFDYEKVNEHQSIKLVLATLAYRYGDLNDVPTLDFIMKATIVCDASALTALHNARLAYDAHEHLSESTLVPVGTGERDLSEAALEKWRTETYYHDGLCIKTNSTVLAAPLLEMAARTIDPWANSPSCFLPHYTDERRNIVPLSALDTLARPQKTLFLAYPSKNDKPKKSNINPNNEVKPKSGSQRLSSG